MRWQYLDVCRVLAIFSVVMIHTIPTGLYPVGSFDWSALSFYNGITRFCVPLFFMISGALFLGPEKKLSVRALYAQYIVRLVTCLLFWSAMYYLVIVYGRDSSFQWSEFDIRSFTAQVLGGHPYHHWFLFMIISLYLLIPLLRCITRNVRPARYYLILWGMFEIGVYSLQLLGISFPGMGEPGLFWVEQAISFAGRVTPTMVMGMSGYMVLGWYLHAHPPGGAARRMGQLLGVAGLLVTLVGTCAVSLRAGELVQSFYSTRSPAVLALSIALFVTARKLWPVATKEENRLLKVLSECCFGVYLVHDFFLVFLRDRGLTPDILPSVIAPPVLTVTCFILSFCTVYLIRKIPRLRDFIT